MNVNPMMFTGQSFPNIQQQMLYQTAPNWVPQEYQYLINSPMIGAPSMQDLFSSLYPQQATMFGMMPSGGMGAGMGNPLSMGGNMGMTMGNPLSMYSMSPMMDPSMMMSGMGGFDMNPMFAMNPGGFGGMAPQTSSDGSEQLLSMLLPLLLEGMMGEQQGVPAMPQSGGGGLDIMSLLQALLSQGSQ